jgi:hypothetical protein
MATLEVGAERAGVCDLALGRRVVARPGIGAQEAHMSNPYDPMEVTEPLAGGSPIPVSSPPGTWGIGEAIGVGWWGLTSWPLAVFGAMILQYLILLPFGFGPILYVAFVDHISPLSPDFAVRLGLVTFPAAIVSMLLSSFLDAGQTKLYLTIVRVGRPSVGQLFSGGDVYLRMLAYRAITYGPLLLIQALQSGLHLAHAPVWPAVAATYAFLLAFSLVMGLGVVFASYFVVDRRMGPVDAIAAAWDATSGQRGAVFVFCLLALSLIVAGECLCLLPMFVAMPVVNIALGFIYTRLGPQPAAVGP